MWFLELLGMAAGALLIKYRERVGEMVGDADWMRYVGGVYNFIVLIGIFIFFWSIAALTGTQGIFLAPLVWFIGGAFGGHQPPVQ